jgi:hypothetical protein
VADEQHKRQKAAAIRVVGGAGEDGPPVKELHTYYKQYQQDKGNDLKQQREKYS